MTKSNVKGYEIEFRDGHWFYSDTGELFDDSRPCAFCHGIPFGTRENKSTMVMPDHWKTDRNSRLIDIDACMMKEISFLWREGVRTISSCCGHGVTSSYIAVDGNSISIMESLGYTHISGRKEMFYSRKDFIK